MSTPWHRLLLVLAVAASPGVGAQAPAAPVPPPNGDSPSAKTEPEVPRTGLAQFFDPEDGQLDLSYFLENPRGFLPIPIVMTEPAVGYGGGVAGMFLRPRREAGDEGWARPDISGVGAFATRTARGVRSPATPAGGSRTPAHDGRRWHRTGQSRLLGLGSDSGSLDQGVRYSLKFSGAIAQANWQLAPSRRGPSALRYVYADVDPKLRDDSAFPGLADRAPGEDLGADCRRRVRHARQRLHADRRNLCRDVLAGLARSAGRQRRLRALPAGRSWAGMPLPHDVTLGARGNYAWSSNGTPFFLRPFVQLRGVPAMRYQGDKVASVELEARWQFSGRWSVVVFGGAGSARTDRQALRRHAERRQRRLRLPLRAGEQVRDACRHRRGAKPRDDRGVFRGGQCLVPALNRCLSSSWARQIGLTEITFANTPLGLATEGDHAGTVAKALEGTLQRKRFRARQDRFTNPRR